MLFYAHAYLACLLAGEEGTVSLNPLKKRPRLEIALSQILSHNSGVIDIELRIKSHEESDENYALTVSVSASQTLIRLLLGDGLAVQKRARHRIFEGNFVV